MRVLYLAAKDFYQIVLDWKTFLFLLIMPVAFTLLFGFAFRSEPAGETDTRLPVSLNTQENTLFTRELTSLLQQSDVIQIVETSTNDEDALRQMVYEGQLAGAITIPDDWSSSLKQGNSPQLELTIDEGSASGTTVQSAVLSAASRIQSSAITARLTADTLETPSDDDTYDHIFLNALKAWNSPSITIKTTADSTTPVETDSEEYNSFAHSSPGMILQFAIAGLIGAAGVVVRERQSKTLQRMLTTSLSRFEILLGHFLAMFGLIFLQVLVLMIFGQILWDLNYLNAPLASLVLAVSVAASIGALGLLIGAVSKTEDAAVVFSLVPMFVFAALGGAWVPLELTSRTVQFVGHFTPVAWGMDGFKNILIRGQGLEGVWLPCAVLLLFGAGFMGLAAWRFKFE